eukprot:2898889-Prymnesium_polylepis.1
MAWRGARDAQPPASARERAACTAFASVGRCLAIGRRLRVHTQGESLSPWAAAHRCTGWERDGAMWEKAEYRHVCGRGDGQGDE